MGVGIPKEDTEKLFTPLFTTKSKGVGLGLAICKSRAKKGKDQHSRSNCQSKEGGVTSDEEGKHPDRG